MERLVNVKVEKQEEHVAEIKQVICEAMRSDIENVGSWDVVG